jgi:adenosylhomocysteine nucleosidase
VSDAQAPAAGRARRPRARVGILAPMELELAAMLADFDAPRTERIISRTFHCGVLYGRDAVAAVAGIGKTAVAVTTTLLVQHFGVTEVLLVGVAGRVAEELAIGDIVVASHLVHHDLDASPIFPRYEVPSLGTARLATDETLTAVAYEAAQSFIGTTRAGDATVAIGLVLSGDQFLDADELSDLRRRFPDGLAVEMEGAAVAQVCIEAGTPFGVVRSISDDGDVAQFERFLGEQSGRYARDIVRGLLTSLP